MPSYDDGVTERDIPHVRLLSLTLFGKLAHSITILLLFPHISTDAYHTHAFDYLLTHTSPTIAMIVETTLVLSVIGGFAILSDVIRTRYNLRGVVGGCFKATPFILHFTTTLYFVYLTIKTAAQLL